MSQSAIHRRKRSLSPHQKQMRFFLGLSLVTLIVFFTMIFWLLNRPLFIAH